VPAPTYQWYFGDVAISGATSTTYSLAVVQTTNAGNYTVTVTNSAGSVTSNAAALTVLSMRPLGLPAVAAGGGSGGGGGGAPSLWFYGALSLLVAIRKAFRRK
jgi:hypothetical protein